MKISDRTRSNDSCDLVRRDLLLKAGSIAAASLLAGIASPA